ncbi:iron-containing redox enzyme family protein [Citricoccus sp. SGAir0253]|uniref:iron-containing redox enzyme family protein n=1 Tax=Citricoccus sp. SGAir0253 TaxID=2567881 RepID=UPI0010CCDD77|nr:iron-containing redox enzyme family protein [Citricoccus sp. SGAir0253]QCU77124.1 iron-containing redox enzyme family protein [Citricoccus sp. SGAir0253]
MLTPTARGPLGEAVLEALRTGRTAGLADAPAADSAEDAQLTLWALYEQHYRGFEDVSGELEWDPHVIGVRRSLEADFERQLRERAPRFPEPGNFAEDFFAFVGDHDGPSLAAHLKRGATEDQFREFLRHKTIYHLKESDHTTWVIPRLSDTVKAAVVELQYDEYGGGDPNRLHAQLFVRGLEAVGLSSEYGAYIDEVPLEVLEQNNAMSLFGLNRRLRAASLGFLAAFEATSSSPSRKIAQGMERLGFPPQMIEYYTEHVEADAVHEQLAVRTICGALLAEEPQLHDDVYLGAFTSLDLDDRYAERMLGAWAA